MGYTNMLGRREKGWVEYYNPGAIPAEKIPIGAPVLFYDDFLKADLYTAADNSAGIWTAKITGAAPPTVALVADSPGGVISANLTAADQKQEAGIYWADNRPLTLNRGLIFEARAALHTLPTLLGEMWIGLGGDYVEGSIAADGPAEHMFFVADGSGAIVIYTDDTANDNDAVATGVTLVADEYAVFRIDCTNPADVRFFINGSPVATGTTFDMSTVAALALQPYVWCHKESGAGLGSLYADYVRAWQRRTA